MFESIVQAVFYHAGENPDKFCIADDGGAFTYAQYRQKICAFAGAFSALGLRADDKAVIEATQSVDYLAMQLALSLIGAVFVPLEHNCAQDKIKAVAEHCSAKCVITAKGAEQSGFLSYAEIIERAGNEAEFVVCSMPKKESVSEILFSTGTTGKEKGIILTHKNNIALAENVMYGVGMEKDNMEMIPSPLNHSHGLRRYYANMYCGASVVLLGSVMDIMRFFNNIDLYGVNSMDLVPTALTMVLRLSRRKLGEYKDRIRYIQLGAAPLMEQDKQKVCELLPDTRLYNFYGSTESGCTCIHNFGSGGSTKKNCIGRPTHNTQLILVDDNRVPIDTCEGATGLIATKGDMNMSGYWQDEAETKKAMENGVIYSNDIGYIDADGDVILLGRKGDVINVGGNKVSPEEIESAAKLMPQVADCGCIPIADSAKGQVPKLFVQVAVGEEFDAAAVRRFLAQRLEPYKVPVLIEKTDKIPRSYNGKLLRKELK